MIKEPLREASMGVCLILCVVQWVDGVCCCCLVPVGLGKRRGCNVIILLIQLHRMVFFTWVAHDDDIVMCVFDVVVMIA